MRAVYNTKVTDLEGIVMHRIFITDKDKLEATVPNKLAKMQVDFIAYEDGTKTHTLSLPDAIRTGKVCDGKWILNHEEMDTTDTGGETSGN